MSRNIICVGDRVILQREKYLKIVEIQRGKKIAFANKLFQADGLIGQPFSCQFDIDGKTVIRVTTDELNKKSTTTTYSTQPGEDPNSTDNRNILDDPNSQKLTQDDIMTMKEQGSKGQEIVDKLIENSSTFKDKNKYAKEKYIKKKKDKHVVRFTVLKPTTRLITTLLFGRPSVSKHCQLRLDTLSQILTVSNIRAGCNVLIAESCQGLLVGAVLDRMGGVGNIIQIHSGDFPVRVVLDNYNFPIEYLNCLHSLPMEQLLDLDINKQQQQGRPELNETSSIEPPVKKLKTADESTVDNPTELCTMNDPPTKSCDTENTVVKSCDTEDTVVMSCDTENTVVKSCDTEDTVIKSCDTIVKSCDGDKLVEEPVTVEMDQLKETSFSVADLERLKRKRKRLAEQSAAKTLLKSTKFDSLIIATKFNPAPILMNTVNLLDLSRPFTIFCQYKEPLIECYSKLRLTKKVINLQLTETWFRHYQVLPGRSHPEMNMSGSSGYILYGYTVEHNDE